MTSPQTTPVWFITGCSTGLGRELAKRVLGRGWRVVVTARDQSRVADLVQGFDGHALALALDVNNDGQIAAGVQAAQEKFGRIDVLVNNAGIMPLAPMAKLKVEEWDRMIDVNVKGVLYGVAAALPRFAAQGSGHIINVSSVAGIKVFAGMGTVYSATKFAVRALTEGLRAEAPDGVRTTIISPGAVDSELKTHSSDQETSEALLAWYEANQIPADSVARAIAYAIEQPANVDISEVVLRPVAQEF